jgi:membrane fusion protein (multidrug efflux system)
VRGARRRDRFRRDGRERPGAGGTAENVLVVPVTAVQGSVQTGNVWVVAGDGTEEMRAVTLGLSDGDQIEVREGLAEGEQVLQFVPVPDDTPVQDPMMGGPVA